MIFHSIFCNSGVVLDLWDRRIADLTNKSFCKAAGKRERPVHCRRSLLWPLQKAAWRLVRDWERAYPTTPDLPTPGSAPLELWPGHLRRWAQGHTPWQTLHAKGTAYTDTMKKEGNCWSGLKALRDTPRAEGTVQKRGESKTPFVYKRNQRKNIYPY